MLKDDSLYETLHLSLYKEDIKAVKVFLYLGAGACARAVAPRSRLGVMVRRSSVSRLSPPRRCFSHSDVYPFLSPTCRVPGSRMGETVGRTRLSASQDSRPKSPRRLREFYSDSQRSRFVAPRFSPTCTARPERADENTRCGYMYKYVPHSIYKSPRMRKRSYGSPVIYLQQDRCSRG